MWSQYTIQDHFVVIQLLSRPHKQHTETEIKPHQLTLKGALTSKFHCHQHVEMLAQFFH